MPNIHLIEIYVAHKHLQVTVEKENMRKREREKKKNFIMKCCKTVSVGAL